MLQNERQTVYRPGWLLAGALVAATGAVLTGLWASRELDAATSGLLMGQLGLATFGWAPAVGMLLRAGTAIGAVLSKAELLEGLAHGQLLSSAGLAWLGGWALIAAGIRRRSTPDSEASPALGAKLHPGLAGYRDFHWGTLAAYGGGILLSEAAFIVTQTVLAGRVQVPPPVAFGFALTLGAGVAFAAGFGGAANARRISIPELTLGLIYFGTPVPALLTALHYVPQLQLSVGYAVREVVYLAEMLGRPQIGYWLVFIVLAFALVLGITTGFVVTGSGRADVRTGYELFIARRHVSIFRPRFLLGALAVLITGIVPALLVMAVLMAAERAVERTRIKNLGLADPLKATAALHVEKLKEASPTWMMTALSVGGVGLGVMSLVIVLSVMSGFEVDLQSKILGAQAHAVILKYTADFSDYPQVMAKAKDVRGVIGATPFIVGEVMIASDQNASGSLIKGIDPATVGEVTDLPKNIQAGGSVDFLEHPEDALKRRLSGDDGALDDRPAQGAREPGEGADKDDDSDDAILERRPAQQTAVPLPGIILGKELAAALKVVMGDRVNVIAPLGGELGPNGPMPKSRPFRVVGLYYSGMYEYDSKSSYIQLGEAQKFFGVKGATGIDLKVANVDDARRISKAVYSELDGYPYRTKDWGEMNHNLFAALRTEKLVMGIILTIIVIVAAGLIVATVIMLVLEKRKEISVLKALGVPDGGIVKIFLAEGLQIGVAGGMLGLVAGLAACLFIEKVGLKLDPEVYYIPALPVKVEPLQTAIAVLIAVLVTYLASIYPALKASRVEPVEGLKAE